MMDKRERFAKGLLFLNEKAGEKIITGSTLSITLKKYPDVYFILADLEYSIKVFNSMREELEYISKITLDGEIIIDLDFAWDVQLIGYVKAYWLKLNCIK